MDIQQLKTFLAVHRTNSFVDVAREMDVAPSSVSRSISNLEKSLGVRLFQRTTRVLTPTQAGDTYYTRMAPLIEEMDRARAELLNQDMQPAGVLRVTASVSYAEIVLAPQLPRFQETYPNINLELELSDRQVDLVNERIDVAIRHGHLADSTLVAKKLCDVHYQLVASPEYLVTHPAPEKPEELDQHRLVTFSYPAYRDTWHFRRRGQDKPLPIHPSVTMTNAGAIRSSARHGLGVALLADWTVRDDLESGRLVRLMSDWEISGTATEAALWAVYPTRKYVPARTRAFTDFLSTIH